MCGVLMTHSDPGRHGFGWGVWVGVWVGGHWGLYHCSYVTVRYPRVDCCSPHSRSAITRSGTTYLQPMTILFGSSDKLERITQKSPESECCLTPQSAIFQLHPGGPSITPERTVVGSNVRHRRRAMQANGQVTHCDQLILVRKFSKYAVNTGEDLCCP